MKSEEHSEGYIINILFKFASHHSLKPGTMEAKMREVFQIAGLELSDYLNIMNKYLRHGTIHQS